MPDTLAAFFIITAALFILLVDYAVNGTTSYRKD